MMFDGVPGVSKLSELGVARISFGPIPFIKAMEALKVAAKTLYAGYGLEEATRTFDGC